MALTGIKIVDLSRMLPGPYCTMMLADLGAEVIRVDDPSFPYGEPPPFLKEGRYYESTFNMILMRNKKSIGLNLKKEGSLDIFYDLIKTADVVVESFRPGVTKRLKIDYDTLKEINPKLIYCSITGYGQDGPCSQEPGHDMNFLALAGSLWLNQDKPFSDKDQTQRPIPPCVQGADIAGSLNAGIAILSAIIHRDRNGGKTGQYIDISLFDAGFAINPYQSSHLIAQSNENILHGDFPFYDVYRTKDDKFLALGTIEMKFWFRLCDAMELPNEFKRLQMRRGDPQQKIREKLVTEFSKRTQEEWLDLFDDVDIPISPVKTPEEALKDPQLIARGMVEYKEHPKFGKILTIGNPIKMSETNPKIKMFARKVGADTKDVLKAIGYTEDEFKKFKRKGCFR